MLPTLKIFTRIGTTPEGKKCAGPGGSHKELIERFGVQIRHEAIKEDEDSIGVVGGLCLLQGQYVLIINSKATWKDRIKSLATAL